MTRHRMHAVGAILVFLALCGVCPTLIARPARAATVFSNYTGVTTDGGFDDPGFLASGFTPADNYNFTGAAVFVRNENCPGQPVPASMALYSSTSAGAPDTSLWTSGTLSVNGPFGAATLVSASYGGSPILLRKGVEYFLALDILFDTEWLGGGSSSTPVYFSPSGSSWSNRGENNLQFELSGSPVAAIPEPSTWAMLLLGFAGLGLLGISPQGGRRGPGSARSEQTSEVQLRKTPRSGAAASNGR